MINWPFQSRTYFHELLGTCLRSAVWAMFIVRLPVLGDMDFELALVPVLVPVLRVRVLRCGGVERVQLAGEVLRLLLVTLLQSQLQIFKSSDVIQPIFREALYLCWGASQQDENFSNKNSYLWEDYKPQDLNVGSVKFQGIFVWTKFWL